MLSGPTAGALQEHLPQQEVQGARAIRQRRAKDRSTAAARDHGGLKERTHARARGKRLNEFQLDERNGFQLDTGRFVDFVRATKSRAAVICNPNNPDGSYLPRREVLYLIDRLAHLDVVVIDESFIDFVDEEELQSVASIAASRGNVIVLKSLGKNFGLHGVRWPRCDDDVRRRAARR